MLDTLLFLGLVGAGTLYGLYRYNASIGRWSKSPQTDDSTPNTDNPSAETRRMTRCGRVTAMMTEFLAMRAMQDSSRPMTPR